MATRAQPAAAAAETFRRTADYHRAVWGPRYFASIPIDESVFESYTKQVEEMKVQVKNMLTDSKVNDVEKVKLIDLLCRLGVSYHFESEIEDFMNQAFDSMHNLARENNDVYDLDTTAIMFRVFRQFGYKMSCDVFDKLKDTDGNFKESLANDLKGLLSLYEASHLNMHGENILDKALAYTSSQLLKSLESECESQSQSNLAKHIAYALQQPFHKGIPRIESREYISFYEEDESCKEMLLKFAKIDYNLVQLFYQRELRQLSRWYDTLDIPSNFPYARERLAEVHMWSVGTYFEPCYSDARVILTKVVTMTSILDDTYDLYATIEELRLLTDAIDRWDIDAVDELPEYMKFLYSSLLNVYQEFENQLKSEGRFHNISYARDAMKELSRAYHLEAEWFHSRIVPTFDEYLENGLLTSSYNTILTGSFLGMREVAGMDASEWLKNNPKTVRASMAIGRLMNDIVTHKDEQKRGDAASGVEVYMKQYGTCETEAVKYVKTKVADAWEDINEGLIMRPNDMSMHLLMQVVNISRTSHFFYKFNDKYTDTISTKDYAEALFIEKIPLRASNRL